MFKNINVLSMLPDRQGRGGSKFGYHSFQQLPVNDTRETKNVHIWQDSWRSDLLPTFQIEGYNFTDGYLTASTIRDCLAVHGYTKFSSTDPTVGPTTEILGHNTNKQGATTEGYIWNYTTVVDQQFEPPASYISTNVVCTASTDSPAVFANIGNRVFIARGSDQVVIYDSSRGDPLYQSTGTPQSYTLGVGAPTAAPVVSSSDVIQTAEIYLRTGSKYISHPDVESALSNAATVGGNAADPANDTLIIRGDGTTWDNVGVETVNITNKTDSFSTAGWTVSIENGTNIATFSPVPPGAGFWNGLKLTVDGEEFVMMAFGNFPQAPSEATLTSAQALLDRFLSRGKLPEDPGGGGGGFDPADDITAATFTVTGVRWELRRNNAAAAWLGGVTTGDPTIVGQLLNTGGKLTWADTPPSYAYAWYDPVTGHISNISPVFSPEATSETDVGIQVNVDVGSISYPPSTTIVPSLTGSSRWTHILFFRTLMAGGSTLYPIGSLSPTVTTPGGVTSPNPAWLGLPNQVVTSIPPSGTGNYWYDSARDADLLISGALRAPQFTNGRPRVIQNGSEQIIAAAHMAYWDGRLWLAGPQDPAALHYSCDRVQCPFGIPEESFADTNVLRIPAEDGCIRGMKLIGENLLVTTERWAYTVAGNNEANYRLIRISTRMAGVGTYQMAEFVSDVEGQGALVVFLGTDSRVYAMPLGGQATWISKEIQTILDSADLMVRANYRRCRVHAVSSSGRRLLVLYVYNETTLGNTYYYDFDTKTWGEHTLRTEGGTAGTGHKTAFATVQTASQFSSEIYAQEDIPNGAEAQRRIRLWRWLQPPGATPSQIPSGYIRTFPMDFDGKKTRKQLHFVRIYISGGSVWTCRLIVDSSSTPLVATFANGSDPVYKLFAPVSSPVDGATTNDRFAYPNSLQLGILGYDAPVIGYTFDIQVVWPSDASGLYRLYRMDVGWSTLSDGQEDL